MAPGWLSWWLEWRGRSAPAPSPVAAPGPSVRLLPAGVPPSAPDGRLDARDVALELARRVLAPPPLDGLDDDVMLAVAPVPGKYPEEWQDKGAWPLWIGWPHAQGAAEAEEMTAAQLRDLLTERDHG